MHAPSKEEHAYILQRLPSNRRKLWQAVQIALVSTAGLALLVLIFGIIVQFSFRYSSIFWGIFFPIGFIINTIAAYSISRSPVYRELRKGRYQITTATIKDASPNGVLIMLSDGKRLAITQPYMLGFHPSEVDIKDKSIFYLLTNDNVVVITPKE